MADEFEKLPLEQSRDIRRLQQGVVALQEQVACYEAMKVGLAIRISDIEGALAAATKRAEMSEEKAGILANDIAELESDPGGYLAVGGLVTSCRREGWEQAKEAAAKIAALRSPYFGGEPMTANERLIVSSIVAAIRLMEYQEG